MDKSRLITRGERKTKNKAGREKKLEKYNVKRDFDRTPEPKGEIINGKDLRFVVQHHIASRDHYDFRLQWQGVLLSWAIPKGPSFNVNDRRLAVRVENHPIEYRNFEGNIPKGEYGGGVVMLWDEGFYIATKSFERGIEKGVLKFELHGERLKGKWTLVKISNEGEKADNWLLIKEKDEFASTGAGISQYSTSIRTNRTMEQIKNNLIAKNIKKAKKLIAKSTLTKSKKTIDKIQVASFQNTNKNSNLLSKNLQARKNKAKSNPFVSAAVMLAKLQSTVPREDGWFYEIKYDGYRVVAYVEGGRAKLVSRNGNDYTKQFKDIAIALEQLTKDGAAVYDGEIVVLDKKGKTDFGALQKYIKTGSGNLIYVIFDLLAVAGKDLREQRLKIRKKKLQELMKNTPDNLLYSQHIEGNGEEFLAAAAQHELEGIIGKRANSVYSGSRCGDWIKIKLFLRQEFIICGYVPSQKKMNGLSSLVLGCYSNDQLIYVGRVGTGFAEKIESELLTEFSNLTASHSPLRDLGQIKSLKNIIWLQPKLIAEIKFTEFTKDNILRHPSFKGLRKDKNPREIVMEKADDFESIKVKKADSKQLIKSKKTAKNTVVSKKADDICLESIITNPQKIMFAAANITKMSLAKYYLTVSQRMMPFVENRILSLICCPKGAGDSCFFKKHNFGNREGVQTVNVSNSSGKSEEYFCINGTLGLLNLVQNNAIEFHTWASSADAPDSPDIMVFDLDPDEGIGLQQVRQGAIDLKAVLDELSLISFLKTSGGKGYHVVVPFREGGDFEAFRAFSKDVAKLMVSRWNNLYTDNVRKEKRKGKIFIDWIRNTKGATSVAPYSVRAREAARVSMPIEWDELETVKPDGIDISAAIERINQKDPWQDFFAVKSRQELLKK